MLLLENEDYGGSFSLHENILNNVNFYTANFCQKKIPYLICSTFKCNIEEHNVITQAIWSFCFRFLERKGIRIIIFARSQNNEYGHSSLE